VAVSHDLHKAKGDLERDVTVNLAAFAAGLADIYG
jgi:hypothetical protein